MATKKIKVTNENVDAVIAALRAYYRSEYRNAESDESFLIWIEGKLPDAEFYEASNGN